jgi:hypothetical protein
MTCGDPQTGDEGGRKKRSLIPIPLVKRWHNGDRTEYHDFIQDL